MRGNYSQSSSISSSDETVSSTEGLKAGNTITINGSSVMIDFSDDSIHSNDLITINGGTYTT